MSKRVLVSLLVLVMVISLSVGAFAAKTVTLKMGLFAQQDIDYFTNKVDLVKAYQKTHPNVQIELEMFKDNAEFASAMTIRKAAGELPDLLPLKGFQVASYADVLLPLDSLKVAKLSKAPYVSGGKKLAFPQTSAGEFTYYRKSIFKEYGIAVPKTWDEYVNAAKKIRDGGKYIPIIMGAKDEWPDYPYNEFIPHIYSKEGGAFWNNMANNPNAFSKEGDLYKSFELLKKLYDAKVFGQDPLGIGFDQGKALFAAGKGAMLPAGQWFLPQVAEAGADMNDVGMFVTPFRTNTSEPLRMVGMYDLYLGVPKTSKYQKEAKEFVEWFFGNANYSSYITAAQLNSTVNGIDSSVPALKGVMDGVNVVVADTYSEKFNKLSDISKFSAKKVGIRMMMGESLDAIFAEMDKAWKEAIDKVK